MFTPEEIAYIQSQPLARLATVSQAGQPDVSPVGFRFDGKRFYITGADITRTFKYKNVNKQLSNKNFAAFENKVPLIKLKLLVNKVLIGITFSYRLQKF